MGSMRKRGKSYEFQVSLGYDMSGKSWRSGALGRSRRECRRRKQKRKPLTSSLYLRNNAEQDNT